MADLKKVFAPKEKSLGVTMVPVMLGSMVLKFTLPMQIIDKINNAYDKAADELPLHNKSLAGKIAEEKLVTSIMTDDMKGLFVGCFQQYLKSIQKPLWAVSLNTAWINEMRANEYNPFHYHTSKISDLGLSSVLVLKTPDTYGEEFSNPDDPSNGYLEFTGGNQDPLGVSQFRTEVRVGEFYVFPYTMLHGVYPFNGTEQTRRTLSYNCDLIKRTKDNA
jgi:hypothetical protein